MYTIFYIVKDFDYLIYQFIRLSLSSIKDRVRLYTSDFTRASVLKTEFDIDIVYTQIDDVELLKMNVLIEILESGCTGIYFDVFTYIIDYHKFNRSLCSSNLIVYDAGCEVCTDNMYDNVVMTILSLSLREKFYHMNLSIIIAGPHQIHNLKSMVHEYEQLSGSIEPFNAINIVWSNKKPLLINQIYQFGIVNYRDDSGVKILIDDIDRKSNFMPWINSIKWSYDPTVSYSKTTPLQMIISNKKTLNKTNGVFYPYLDVLNVGGGKLAVNTQNIVKKFNNYNELSVRYASKEFGLYIPKVITTSTIPKVINQIWLGSICDSPLRNWNYPDDWSYKVWLCDCVSDEVLGRWKDLFYNCCDNKELILSFAILDRFGGVILAPYLSLSYAPDMIVNNTFFSMFDNEKCSVNLSYDFFGSVKESSTLNDIYIYLSKCGFNKQIVSDVIKKNTDIMIYPSNYFCSECSLKPNLFTVNSKTRYDRNGINTQLATNSSVHSYTTISTLDFIS